jgi:hypothetical protein
MSVRHIPVTDLAALGGKAGISLVQVPWRGGGLRAGPVGAIPMASAYNAWPQKWLPVESTPDEWLSLFVDAQRLDRPMKTLLVTSDAAALLDLDTFQAEHPTVKVRVLDE